MTIIAHIGNTAGVPITIAREQRKKGHQVDVFVFDKKTKEMFEEGELINWNNRLSRFLFIRRLSKYDVWHYHYPYGLLRTMLQRKRDGHKYIKHYHGADLRLIGFEEDRCLVATPDLLPRAKNGQWLPTALDIGFFDNIIEKWAFSPDNQHNMPEKVIYYPAHKIQSTVNDNVSQPLAELVSEGKCESIETLGFRYNDLMKMILGSDIVVGKVNYDMGWFGKFELEGMALGKPVIAYVSDELYSKYKPPIYRTSKESFKKDLEYLLGSPSTRETLAKDGFEYVRKVHDVRKTVDFLRKYYESS